MTGKKFIKDIPLPVGQVCSLIAGSVLGKELGDRTNEVINEHHLLPADSEATQLALMGVSAGSIGLCVTAALNLAAKNPAKSVMIAAEVIAGLGAVKAVENIAHQTEQAVRDEVNQTMHQDDKTSLSPMTTTNSDEVIDAGGMNHDYFTTSVAQGIYDNNTINNSYESQSFDISSDIDIS